MAYFRNNPAHADDGFSLIEALVALTIFAFAAVALLQVQSESARAAVALEDKLLAEIVADNVLAAQMMEPGLEAGARRQGKTTLGDRTWHWDLSVAREDKVGLMSFTVVVTHADTGQQLYEVSALVGDANVS